MIEMGELVRQYLLEAMILIRLVQSKGLKKDTSKELMSVARHPTEW